MDRRYFEDYKHPDHTELLDALRRAATHRYLNDWERQFTSDVLKKYVYDYELSPKQRRKSIDIIFGR